MKILVSLMYYRPHYSGLTIYAERLARALAARGNQVLVLTSRFDPALPEREVLDGVTIIRPWVMLRLSKGVIMPAMPAWAWRLIRQVDVVNAHVPQPDAAVITALGRWLRKPVVMTYHCDLQLPRGTIHFLANQTSHLTNLVSARFADCIVTNTRDYAENSPFLKGFLPKLRPILPPIELARIGESHRQAFREKFGIRPGERIIGMAARLATEKGVEYLVEAMPTVLRDHPRARVLFAGQHQGVLGEEAYARHLAPLIGELGEHWSFLGLLSPEEMAAFFQIAEVTVLPSINSTESFGMVQIESMISGTPVIATDLPGVRQPVRSTGMGLIVPPADAAVLAVALSRVLAAPQAFQAYPAAIAARFAPGAVAREYELLFQQLLAEQRKAAKLPRGGQKSP